MGLPQAYGRPDMRRAGSFLAVGLIFLGTLPTHVALADIVYTDTGFDPDDASAPGVDDVEFTRRTVGIQANGRRFIRVRVRTYDPLGRDASIRAVLDSRGDRRKDAYIALEIADGGPVCSLNVLGVGFVAIGPAEKFERTISCAFRLSHLSPTKRIRWRILSPSRALDPSDIDHAPDQGWYV